MKIQEEKQFIYEMMKNITEERRSLTDQYYGLKERLDYLCRLEEQGIEELDLKGYTELHKKSKEQSINNIKKQVDFISSKIEESNIIEEKEKSVIPEEVLERRKTKTIRKARVNKEKVYSAIIESLKDAGKPIKLAELHQRIEEKMEQEVGYKNLQVKLIKEAMEKYPRITKPHTGYYQYKF